MHGFRVGVRYARLVVIVPVVVLMVLLFSQAQSPAVVFSSSLPVSSLRGDPLVVPSGGSFFAGQSSAANVARRLSPGAVFARQRSRMGYLHLGASGAVRLLRGSFPSLVTDASGVPALPSGARITGYPTSHALDVSLPGNGRAVVESSVPLAVRSGRGRFTPIDLGVKSAAGGFGPVRSSVGVRIPGRISAGVVMPSDGVSLTPVDSDGHALGGSGSVAGSAVVYANTQLATDTVVKPTALGFEIDAVLRSVDSPEVLYYRVGAPRGSVLVQNRRTGAIEVLLDGSVIGTVRPPGSVDAAGVSVPTTMSLSDSTVVVDVAHRATSYLYPIDVDPEVTGEDKQLAAVSGGKATNWEFKSSNEAKFGHKEGPGELLETTGIAEYKSGEVASWLYQTKGDSKIYEAKTNSSAKNKSARLESYLEIEPPSGLEVTKKLLSSESVTPEYGEKPETICAWNTSKGIEECNPPSGKEKNALRFEQLAVGSPGANYKFSDALTEAVVLISEPSGQHATTSFNTSSSELTGEVEEEGGKKSVQSRKNALYGSGVWLSKFQGALQFIAKDTGIGIDTTRLEYEKVGGGWEILSQHENLGTSGCKGVQCYPETTEFWTVDPKLPDGEDKIRYRAEEALAGTVSLSTETESTKTVRVDTKRPVGLHLLGLPGGNELSERQYKLSGVATDGADPTVASSGIKSITLFVEGHAVSEVGTQVGCTVSVGECTAKAEWVINAAELGAGHHAVVMVATDNAGNEERLPLTVSVHHSTPINLGPGSVDLQSGDYAVGAKDVAMGTGLTVERNYSSRAVEQGLEGGLGQQWNLSLGTSESLSELIDGGVLLTSANGEQTIFAPLGGGKFESPTGDSNITLELEENKTTKQKLAYFLIDSAAGTKVKFTQPSGSGVWVPTEQLGTSSADTLTYAYRTVEHHLEYPVPGSNIAFADMTTGPNGNIWFLEDYFEHYVVGEMTPSGVIRSEHPLGYTFRSITTGSDNNLWIAAGNDTILRMEPNAQNAQPYFVPKGSTPENITPGPEGSLWFTESGTSKIGRITTAGEIKEYALPAGSGPDDIAAGPDGNLWFTERATNKIGRINTSGTIIGEYALPAGSIPIGIAKGPEKDKRMWFTDAGTSKIGAITTSGTISIQEYSLPASSSPEAIIKGADEHMWFVEKKTEKIGKISASGTITEYSSFPANTHLKAITTGPEGNIWFGNEFLGTSGALGMMTPSGTMTEPTEVKAPSPAGVTCSPMKAGCRSLKFSYNSTNQLLKTVSLEAYEPTAKKMQETAVAEYSYNEKGWLTAEWDPRVSPALKATYGYDEEGHLTALTEPGQETWGFIYGTIPGDIGTGRLLKVARPSATTGLWNGEATKNTEAPKITGTPLVGVRLSVSDGTWTSSPVAYTYQWKDCQVYPEWACTVIPGANSANYTPVPKDVGYTLTAVVSATNGGGTIAAASARTAAIETREFTEYSLPSGSEPYGIAAGPDGRMWFTDEGNGKVGAVSPSSEALTEYATGKNYAPEGITGGPDGNVWWVEHSVRNIDHITPAGGVTSYTLTRTSTYNVGIVKGPDGNLWFTEATAKYVGVINTKDEVVKEYPLPSGSKPYGITVGSDGNIWVADNGLNRIDKIMTAGVIVEYPLPAGSQPYWITSGPEGNLWFTDNGTNKVGKITTAGVITEYALPAGSQPRGITARSGWTSLYVAEYGTNKIATVSSTNGTVIEEASLPTGSEPSGIIEGPDNKDLWFTEYGRNKIVRYNPSHTEGSVTEGSVRTPVVGFALEYGVPLSGSGGLPTMTSSEVSKWGQQDLPVEGTAVIPPDSAQGWPASNYTRASIYYLDGEGNTVNVSVPSEAMYGSISTTEYNEMRDVTRTLSPANRQTALEAGGGSVDEAKLLSTYYTYGEECSRISENKHEAEGDPGARLCKTEGPVHEIKYREGSAQVESLARLHTKYFYDENSLSGATYNLLTKKQAVAELFNSEGSATGNEVEAHTTVNSYSGQSNAGWKLRAPTSVTEDPEGKKIVHTTIYNTTTAQIEETRGPAGSVGNSAHDMKFIYYTSAANTEYPSCGTHPEWGGLTCETLPAKQPAAGVAPQLPVTVITSYNMWNEPLVTTETFGTTVRTRTDTYDAGGRLATSEVSSTANTALPKVTNEYNTTTGALEKQSTTVEAKTKTITAKHNKLGQMTEYIDADGNTAKYKYAGPENDLMLEEVSDGSNGGTGHQVYSYNTTTKLLEKLQDSAAGTFTASYDAEGRILKEIYPNAMCANTKYNSAGEAIKIQYIKTSNCGEVEPKVWFSEARVPSVRGEIFSRSSTLATEAYAYDSLGKVTETQETPTGEGCSVRLYGYDEESNRTSQTTRTPETGGKCATTGGTELTHSYDEGNRLTDTGTTYDAFGDVTKLPAADAEGHELSSTFYVDGAVATQTQNGTTNNYFLDPEGRAREAVSGSNTIINHYDAEGETVAWTSETGGKSTRSIPGIGGILVATQTNGETPVLQLTDLAGNIIATASLSTEATSLLSTYNSTEFGVPNAGKTPPKFAWLGAGGITTALSSGVVTYGATSYVPQIGQSLQSEQVEPPGAPRGSGMNTPYTAQAEPWVMQGAARAGAEAAAAEAARERAAAEAALAAAWVDPQEVHYMNKTKARGVAEKLWESKTEAELAGALAIPTEWIGAAVGIISGLGLDDIYQWFDETAEMMSKCGNNKWPSVEGVKPDICKIEYSVVHALGKTFVNFSSSAKVWECFDNSGETCFHEVYADKKEKSCTLGIICIA